MRGFGSVDGTVAAVNMKASRETRKAARDTNALLAELISEQAKTNAILTHLTHQIAQTNTLLNDRRIA